MIISTDSIIAITYEFFNINHSFSEKNLCKMVNLQLDIRKEKGYNIYYCGLFCRDDPQ